MKNEQKEISLENYDEVEDSYEIRASREVYEKECAKLLAKVSQRDELVKLLKIARPEKLGELRASIAKLDAFIAHTEEIIAMHYDIYQKRQDLWKQETELLAISEAIRPELLKYVAQHNPERLEELEAMFSDDDKSH